MSNIEVLIVDDHPMFRQGIKDVVTMHPDAHVVGQVATGEEAIEQARVLKPDVILMDVNLPTLNGLQVTRIIKKELAETKVIILTGYDDAEQVFHALRAGASAYCPKDIMPTSLVQAIIDVYEGYYVVGEQRMSHEEVIGWIEEKIGRLNGGASGDEEDMFIPLTPREMEVLEYVTSGLSNKQVAYELGISHQTVKNHMTSILRKLNVFDRTQAAVYALSHGWIRLQDASPVEINLVKPSFQI